MDPSSGNASNVGSNTKHFHVLMYPSLAHGHFSAFAELSKRIADQGIQVSFLTTALNIPRVKPMLANHDKIQLLKLPFPVVEGLPAGIECTSDTPPHLRDLFRRAMHLLEKPFERLLHSIATPDCIVYDLLEPWSPKVAAKFGIPTVLFLTYGGAYCGYELSPHRAKCGEISAKDLTRPPPGYPSSAISLRPFEARLSMNLFYAKNDSTDGMRRIDQIVASIECCHAIAVKSCNELERKFIEYFQKVAMKPVLPVGPLLLSMQPGLIEGDSNCLEWLDKQHGDSVIYVSFGSECDLTGQQIHELALGLEAAQQPFILVLRGQSDLLPDGFEKRIEKRGFVFSGWAPQREILCHRSIGAFVTHCGWNSVMEGMGNGLPLIALPIQYDQWLNARLIVQEFKVGVEVEREDDGLANKEQIYKAVRRIMVEEGGKEIKQRAGEMGKLFRRSINNESQEECIDNFVEHLISMVGEEHSFAN